MGVTLALLHTALRGDKRREKRRLDENRRYVELIEEIKQNVKEAKNRARAYHEKVLKILLEDL